jgi:nucleotide-binding universal stress UspA family protein
LIFIKAKTKSKCNYRDRLLEEAGVKPQFHLPLITYPSASSFSVVQNAVDFAHHNKADLTASILQIKMPLIRHSSPWIADADKLSSEAKRFSRDSGMALSETLHDYARKTEIRAVIQSFEASESFVAGTLAERSRAYDLSIMEASETMRPLIESVLFESGRPLILFPADNFCGRIDTVAVAWDGSATLSRALTGARLFLECASKVILISITDDKPINEKARDQHADVLRNAGLEVEVATAQAYGARAAGVIQSVAAANRADLLVAGAYGHSKLREFILGGVTRSLLVDLEMPVLLVH